MKIEDKAGKLIITDFNEAEAYLIATKIEKDGMYFYNRLAMKEKVVEVKRMLEAMVEEERKHLQFFETRLSEMEAQAGIDVVENDLLSSMDFGVFQPYQDMTHLEEVLTDAKMAIRLGVLVESRAIEFYKYCSEQVQVVQVKSHLERIIKEEIDHKRMFQEWLCKL